MAYVIRSMSTTDYRMAYRSGTTFVPEQKPVPYHVYLMPREKRTRAFWSWILDAMKFASIEEAQAEIDLYGLTSCDIVPEDHEALGLPTYWEKLEKAA